MYAPQDTLHRAIVRAHQRACAHKSSWNDAFCLLLGLLATFRGQRVATNSKCRHSVLFSQHDCDDTLGDRRISRVGRVRSERFVEIIDLEKDRLTIDRACSRPEPSRFCRQATFGQSNAKSSRARVICDTLGKSFQRSLSTSPSFSTGTASHHDRHGPSSLANTRWPMSICCQSLGKPRPLLTGLSAAALPWCFVVDLDGPAV